LFPLAASSQTVINTLKNKNLPSVVVKELCQPCCKECPAVALLPDYPDQLAIVAKKLTLKQQQAFAKAGLSIAADETAGMVPLSLFKQFVTQWLAKQNKTSHTK
jgi:hypothetical protein